MKACAPLTYPAFPVPWQCHARGVLMYILVAPSADAPSSTSRSWDAARRSRYSWWYAPTPGCTGHAAAWSGYGQARSTTATCSRRPRAGLPLERSPAEPPGGGASLAALRVAHGRARHHGQWHAAAPARPTGHAARSYLPRGPPAPSARHAPSAAGTSWDASTATRAPGHASSTWAPGRICAPAGPPWSVRHAAPRHAAPASRTPGAARHAPGAPRHAARAAGRGRSAGAWRSGRRLRRRQHQPHRPQPDSSPRGTACEHRAHGV